MIPMEHVLILGAILFGLGVYGVLARRNAVLILLSVELMLNAVNLNLIAFNVYLRPHTSAATGMVFSIFVIVVAAAEAGLALAIILRLFRNRRTANVDEADLMKW
jgi:NADH:ubiquinone oxidoreductase subunit K